MLAVPANRSFVLPTAAMEMNMRWADWSCWTIRCRSGAFVLAAIALASLLSLVGLRAVEAAQPDDIVVEAQRAFYESGDIVVAEELAGRILASSRASYAGHEILGLIAEFKGDPGSAFEHFLAAATDVESDATAFHLAKLKQTARHPRQWKALVSGMQTLSLSCPNQRIADLARYIGLEFSWRLDDVDAARSSLRELGNISDWLVVAGFENDRLSGFDAAYGPERDGVDVEAVYQGQRRPVRWRKVQQLDEVGRIPLRTFHTPGEWSVAYVATWVHSDSRQSVQLMTTTSDPVKIWLNQGLVASTRHVKWSSFDQLAIPVELNEGWNLLMIKSCQGTGPWVLGVRLTGPGGGKLAGGLETSSEPHSHAPAVPQSEWTEKTNLSASLPGMSDGKRKEYLRTYLLRNSGFPLLSLKLLESELASSSPPPFPLYEGALAAWDQQENEKAVAALSDGIRLYPHLVRFSYMRARFFLKAGRLDRALDDVKIALAGAPGWPEARLLQAELMRRKGWHEEGCSKGLSLLEDAGDWSDLLRMMSRCAERRKRYAEARQWLEKALKHWPTNLEIIVALADKLVDIDDSRAERYYRSILDLYPHKTRVMMSLGNLLRKNKQFDEARQRYLTVTKIDPEYDVPYAILGDIAMERGKTSEAASFWQDALVRNPDNHSLWERLDRLAPAGKSLVAEYTPTRENLDDAIASAWKVDIQQDSSWVGLLHHEVRQIGMDGSARGVTTWVVLIEDGHGRDHWSEFELPRTGYVRVLRSFVVDPSGKEREVTSIRERKVKFVELQEKSIVVLQFRHDSYQQAVLQNHWASELRFQQGMGQVERSEAIFIVPKERKLGVFTRGALRETIVTRDGQLVYNWTAAHIPALSVQPHSVPVKDLLAKVVVSTIPDWSFIASWIWAMLEEPLHVTPQIRREAGRIAQGAADVSDTVDQVYDYVANKVRYQQDYEVVIAGFRPHPASVTLERQYGDCKDKAVLMIALLEALGIEARYAPVSTFNHGRLIPSVPSSQFNHVVVYIPQQQGIESGFFLDPTAEYLDRRNLRWDVQGRKAMVMDGAAYEFMDIPTDSPSQQVIALELVVDTDSQSGDGVIRLKIESTGRLAAMLRKSRANSEVLEQGLTQFVTGELYPGARIENSIFDVTSDITESAVVTVVAAVPNMAKTDGKSLRLAVPDPAQAARSFGGWAERRHPLVFGPPRTIALHATFNTPQGFETEQLPTEREFSGKCAELELRSRSEEGKAVVEYRLTRTCSELDPEDYEVFRDTVLEIDKLLSQPVVMTRQLRGH